jgi:hypothetical protein
MLLARQGLEEGTNQFQRLNFLPELKQGFSRAALGRFISCRLISLSAFVSLFLRERGAEEASNCEKSSCAEEAKDSRSEAGSLFAKLFSGPQFP